MTATEDAPHRGILKRLFFWLKGNIRTNKPADIKQAIHRLVDEGEEKGVFDEEQGEMLESIFEFKDTSAKEVMIPRTDIVGVEVKTPILEVIRLAVGRGHSRIPIFEGHLDHIIGILHVKDLLKYWGEKEVSLHQIMRSPFFVPETKKIGDLLKDFRNRRFHMAIVLDEYGGTSGLVTVEDIVEEILGEIQDEHDVEEQKIIRIDASTVLADGRLDVKELGEYFKVEIPEEKFESVGGLIIYIAGKVPKTGETITFRNLEFTVKSANDRRIQKVRVRKLDGENLEAIQV